MTWGNDEIRESEFNTAAQKMRSLREILDRVNYMWMDPLGVDPLTGEEHHILIFRGCDAVYLEIQASLNKENKEKLEKLREVLDKYIRKHPIRVPIRVGGRPNGKFRIDKEIWEKIREGLWIYQKEIRQLLLDVGMDTKQMDDWRGG